MHDNRWQRQCVSSDKVKGGYTGITFPGGHIEPGEAFRDAIIREGREETGFTIHNPVKKENTNEHQIKHIDRGYGFCVR